MKGLDKKNAVEYIGSKVINHSIEQESLIYVQVPDSDHELFIGKIKTKNYGMVFIFQNVAFDNE
jgi:hypothetical protein